MLFDNRVERRGQRLAGRSSLPPSIRPAPRPHLVHEVHGPLQEGVGAFEARHKEARGPGVGGDKVHHAVLEMVERRWDGGREVTWTAGRVLWNRQGVTHNRKRANAVHTTGTSARRDPL